MEKESVVESESGVLEGKMLFMWVRDSVFGAKGGLKRIKRA